MILELLSFIGDIMVVVGVFAMVVAAYWWLALRRASQKIQAELEKGLLQIDQDRLVLLRVEVNNDQFLCYNLQTKDFVCQGSNMGEIRQRFKQRFPHKNAAICDGDETAIRMLNTQIEELYETGTGIRSSP